MSAKKPRSCGFCKKKGCQVNSCSVKNEFGEYTNCSGDKLNEIALKLANISEGLIADFRNMATIMDSNAIRQMFVDSIPQGTKRLQVKGYANFDYVFWKPSVLGNELV